MKIYLQYLHDCEQLLLNADNNCFQIKSQLLLLEITQLLKLLNKFELTSMKLFLIKNVSFISLIYLIYLVRCHLKLGQILMNFNL